MLSRTASYLLKAQDFVALSLSSEGGLQALRCCPVCRKATHYITPSKVWPRTPEEKDLIVGQYKARLASIDCKYWERSLPGDKRCPFGTSCFYRHKGAEVSWFKAL